MEKEPNNTKQSSLTTGEELFDKLSKVIVSWFQLLKNTVWVFTIFLGLFTIGGVAFFGYNLWEIQKEVKMRLEEFEKTSKELHAKAAEIDSLEVETSRQLKSIATRYNKNFEIIGKQLKLPEIVPYTESPK